jgi:ATP synthase protein I
MSDEPTTGSSRPRSTFADEIGGKAQRKLEAQHHPPQVWFGIGMMGLIGWSVAIPTLLGAALGVWLDERHSGHSWTLALLVAGLVIGCLNAGRWVASENRKIREETEERDD